MTYLSHLLSTLLPISGCFQGPEHCSWIAVTRSACSNQDVAAVGLNTVGGSALLTEFLCCVWCIPKCGLWLPRPCWIYCHQHALRSLSSKLLPSHSSSGLYLCQALIASSQFQNLAFTFVELGAVDHGPMLPAILIPLQGLSFLWRISNISPVCFQVLI